MVKIYLKLANIIILVYENYNKCNKNLGTLESKLEYNFSKFWKYVESVTTKMELHRPDLFEVLRLLWK